MKTQNTANATKKMRGVSEQSIIKVLVNFKCIGRPGRLWRSFTQSQRSYILDELIRRGYMDEHINVLPASREIVTANLHLCEA